MYNFSIVFDEPPAPAALVELGFETCDDPAALLLIAKCYPFRIGVRKSNHGRYTHRICAPGGFATAEAEGRGLARLESESDYSFKLISRVMAR